MRTQQVHTNQIVLQIQDDPRDGDAVIFLHFSGANSVMWQRAMAEYIAHYFRYRFEAYYPRVQCPLLLVPDADVLKNERERVAVEGLCALTAHGRIAYVEGWNHPYGWLLAPEGVCREVLGFLAEAGV